MTYKTVLITLLSLMILIGSWRICGAEESILNELIPIEIDVQGLQSLDQCLQRQPILEDLVKKQVETIEKLQTTLGDTQRELSLEKRENELNQRMLDIKDKEIAVLNQDFERMKEITDRAIKLAETAKPKTDWKMIVWPITVILALIGGALL